MHEVHHAVMRAPEPEFSQHSIGITDEIAVGEEQQFDNVPARLRRPGS